MSKLTSEKVSVNGFAFNRLSFEAYPLYAHYFCRATHEDLTFYGSFPLMMYKRFGYKIIDGFLFIFRYIRTDSQERIDSVGLPISESGSRLDVDSTIKCLSDFNRRPGGRVIHLHPALSARPPTVAVPRQSATVSSEYIYSNELLARLEGGTFKNLRKNVNRFASHHTIEIVPYDRSFRADADRIYHRWRAAEGAKYESIWDGTLFSNLLDHHGTMDHHLFMVIDKTSSERIGLFDAARISPHLAIGVMRKLDSNYANLAEYCQVFLARHLHALGCPFLNDGDDAGGRPGLKEIKSRFHPISIYTPLQYK